MTQCSLMNNIATVKKVFLQSEFYTRVNSYLSKECLQRSPVPQRAQTISTLHEGLAQVSGAWPGIKQLKNIFYFLSKSAIKENLNFTTRDREKE